MFIIILVALILDAPLTQGSDPLWIEIRIGDSIK